MQIMISKYILPYKDIRTKVCRLMAILFCKQLVAGKTLSLGILEGRSWIFDINLTLLVSLLTRPTQ